VADEEQVKRLKQGVAGWNAWREQNPETEIDLSAADLGYDANLRNADLHRANLCDALRDRPERKPGRKPARRKPERRKLARKLSGADCAQTRHRKPDWRKPAARD
jgi:hypothetical protein